MNKMLISKVMQNSSVTVKYNFYQSTVQHSHNFFELMYIMEGSLTNRVNSSEETIMQKGDYMIMDIGTNHEYNGNSLKLINTSFLPIAIDPGLIDCNGLSELLKHPLFGLKGLSEVSFPTNTVLHDSDGKILSVIEAMAAIQNSSAELSEKSMTHLLVALLLQILNTQKSALSEKSASEITSHILKTVKRHYADDNLLVGAAQKLNYSLSYLSYTFKKDMGVSFKTYLQKYRTDVAANFLENTDIPIYEISNAVGYSDLKSFNRIFKSFMDMTPSEYRKVKKLSKQIKTNTQF